MGETEAFGLGRQLAGLPNQERLAQGDLAQATGIGRSEISRIEQGKGTRRKILSGSSAPASALS